MRKTLNTLRSFACLAMTATLFFACEQDDPDADLQGRLDAQKVEMKEYLSTNNITTDEVEGIN